LVQLHSERTKLFESHCVPEISRPILSVAFNPRRHQFSTRVSSHQHGTRGELEYGAVFTNEHLNMQMESWVGQIEREWLQLRSADSMLDVEKFFKHVVAASKTGFVSLESLAAIANALLTSTLSGAPILGRRLLDHVGVNRHPSLRVALAVFLVTSTGSDADYTSGNTILEDVIKDDSADGRLRGIAAAALADSARIGRGIDPDADRARVLYERAVDFGHKASAHNLGLYWEGVWGAPSTGATRNRQKAIQMYRRGGDDARCLRRIQALR
jgi:hypothetical protein